MGSGSRAGRPTMVKIGIVCLMRAVLERVHFKMLSLPSSQVYQTKNRSIDKNDNWRPDVKILEWFIIVQTYLFVTAVYFSSHVMILKPNDE